MVTYSYIRLHTVTYGYTPTSSQPPARPALDRWRLTPLTWLNPTASDRRVSRRVSRRAQHRAYLGVIALAWIAVCATRLAHVNLSLGNCPYRTTLYRAGPYLAGMGASAMTRCARIVGAVVGAVVSAVVSAVVRAMVSAVVGAVAAAAAIVAAAAAVAVAVAAARAVAVAAAVAGSHRNLHPVQASRDGAEHDRHMTVT